MSEFVNCLATFVTVCQKILVLIIFVSRVSKDISILFYKRKIFLLAFPVSPDTSGRNSCLCLYTKYCKFIFSFITNPPR